jgi:hypothetical protein
MAGRLQQLQRTNVECIYHPIYFKVAEASAASSDLVGSYGLGPITVYYRHFVTNFSGVKYLPSKASYKLVKFTFVMGVQ